MVGQCNHLKCFSLKNNFNSKTTRFLKKISNNQQFNFDSFEVLLALFQVAAVHDHILQNAAAITVQAEDIIAQEIITCS